MHIGIAIWTVLASLIWGDWHQWRKYLPTMLYMSLSNLLYLYLTSDFWLWRIVPDFLLEQKEVAMLYTFIVFPCTVIVFLSHYPDRRRGQLLHFAKWIIIYGVVEWIGFLTGRIDYAHGWSIWWSLFFLCMMFPMLVLHHFKPLYAHVLSVFWVTFYILVFQVPM